MVENDPSKINLLEEGDSSPDYYIKNCHKYYEGKISKYLIGNSEMECYNTDKVNAICSIQGNSFESSGIYYIKKMNFLQEQERIYCVPPLEVNIK